jgi:hypothetical protein
MEADGTSTMVLVPGNINWPQIRAELGAPTNKNSPQTEKVIYCDVVVVAKQLTIIL